MQGMQVHLRCRGSQQQTCQPTHWRHHAVSAPLLQRLTAYKAPADTLHRLSTSLLLMGKGTVDLSAIVCTPPSAIKGDLSRWTGQPHRPYQGNQHAFGGPVLLSPGSFQPLHGCRGVVKVAAGRLSHQIHQLRGVKAAFGIGLHPQQPQGLDAAQTDVLPPDLKGAALGRWVDQQRGQQAWAPDTEQISAAPIVRDSECWRAPTARVPVRVVSSQSSVTSWKTLCSIW